jgi:broad specificity phosphatase PhoE
MIIYFVRHGQTPANVENRFQTMKTPLSLEGELQGTKLAERFQNLTINEIWSSPMRRARQTADFINEYQNVTVTEVAELREIRRPSILEGKLRDEPTVQHIMKQIWAHQNDPYFKYEDGESFAEMVERA